MSSRVAHFRAALVIAVVLSIGVGNFACKSDEPLDVLERYGNAILRIVDDSKGDCKAAREDLTELQKEIDKETPALLKRARALAAKMTLRQRRVYVGKVKSSQAQFDRRVRTASRQLKQRCGMNIRLR